MFTIKTPPPSAPDHSGVEDMLDKGQFTTLDRAIHAALDANLDLESTVIEADGVFGSLSDWISVRIAGGDVRVG